jgi:signal transduction histidine kinase
MGQLFNNLIGNALKFSKKGVAPEVRISARPLPKNRIGEHPSLSPELSYTELTVSDNGIGFDPQYHEQIFMIFQRLRQSKEYKGSGIGLSLVKKIIENHHGAVYTVSEEGQGAEFHVILPVERPE